MGSDAPDRLWLRRTIAAAGALLAVAIAFVVYSGLGANTRRDTPTFFDNAVAVPHVFKRALGPTSLLIALEFQPTYVSAHILTGPQSAQRFELRREVGYVVAKEAVPVEREPGEIAFALETVDFAALPAIVNAARPGLGLAPDAAPERVRITRPRGSRVLRWRVYAAGRHVDHETPVGAE